MLRRLLIGAEGDIRLGESGRANRNGDWNPGPEAPTRSKKGGSKEDVREERQPEKR